MGFALSSSEMFLYLSHLVVSQLCSSVHKGWGYLGRYEVCGAFVYLSSFHSLALQNQMCAASWTMVPPVAHPSFLIAILVPPPTPQNGPIPGSTSIVSVSSGTACLMNACIEFIALPSSQ